MAIIRGEQQGESIALFSENGWSAEAGPELARYRHRRQVGSLVETSFAFFSILLFAVDLPQTWFTSTDALNTDANVNASLTGPLSSIVFLAIAGVAFLILLPNFQWVFGVIRANKPLMILTLWILMSTLWSEDIATTGRRSMSVAITVFFGAYLALRFSRHQILHMSAIALATNTMMNLVWVFALPQYGIMQNSDLWSGIYFNKNELGMVSTLAAIILALQTARSPISRIWTIPALAGAFTLLLGSQSKTSLASAVLITMLMGVYQFFRSREKLFGAVALSMFSASAIGVLFATAALPLLTELLDKDITLTGRTSLWANLIPEISRRPFLGHGYSAYWNGWLSPARRIWLLEDWNPPSAHNAALEYLLQIGVVGLVAVLIFFATSVVRSTRLIRDFPGAPATLPIAMLSYMLMFSMTESGILSRGIGWLLVSASTMSAATLLTGEKMMNLSKPAPPALHQPRELVSR